MDTPGKFIFFIYFIIVMISQNFTVTDENGSNFGNQLLKKEIIVAPGTYCPEKVNLDKGPQCSLSGKGPSEKPNDNP